MPLIIFWLWIGPSLNTVLDLGPTLNLLSDPLQKWCVAQIPFTTHHELTAAMLCGLDPSRTNALVFQVSGLYHLLVVSGGHLAFFANLLQPLLRVRFGRLCTFVALALYSLTCGAQPPVVRALLQWLVVHNRHRLGLHSHPGLYTWYSGILCLILVPAWVHSLSFWLSWLATLACQLAISLRLSAAMGALLIHMVLLPGLLNLGSAHPMSVVNNWLLAPLLGGVLLPLCLVTCLVPSLAFVRDAAWSWLILILEPLNQMVTTTSFQTPRLGLILYVLLLQILAWQGWIWWQRRF